jgi:hypothetical protein
MILSYTDLWMTTRKIKETIHNIILITFHVELREGITVVMQ